LEAIFLRGKSRKIGRPIFGKEKEGRKPGRPIFGKEKEGRKPGRFIFWKEKVRQKNICLRGKDGLWKESEKEIKFGESTFALRC